MDTKNYLQRSYSQKFEGYKCTFFVDEIMANTEEVLIKEQDLFSIKKVKETKENNEVIFEESFEIVKFSSELYDSVKLIKMNVKKGDDVTGVVDLFEYEVEDNFLNLIYKSVQSFSKNINEIHSSPIIPPKKLDNAVKAYGGNMDKDRVLYLYDDTVFGSAKDGFLISDTSFTYKVGTKSFNFRLVDYTDSEIVELPKSANSNENQKVLRIQCNSDNTGEFIEIPQGGILKLVEFREFLELTKSINGSKYIKEADSYVIIQDLADDIKLNYIKAIVCFTHLDDGEIDSDEVSEIQTLMTQLEFISELRSQVREMIIGASEFSLTSIVEELNSELQSGSEQAVRVSLLKDIVRVHSATKNTKANTDDLVKEVAQILDINQEQLDFIYEAYLYDKKILSGDISDDELTQGAKALASKAGAVGVPIAAVYLSGSVVGLSAAGLTSGLATLGLGGVLGLSSMVTGIGVVILLGVGIYKGLQWALGSSERDKASRREFMLQEVLRIHQKTISNLAEDVNFFSLKIIDALGSAEENKLKIEKLAEQMNLFSQVIKSQKEKIEIYESDLEEESSKRE